MEPQQNEVESVIAPLKKVTPLSKYLALFLFIILPFVGAYIGYKLAPEKVVEVERVKFLDRIASDSPKPNHPFYVVNFKKEVSAGHASVANLAFTNSNYKVTFDYLTSIVISPAIENNELYVTSKEKKGSGYFSIHIYSNGMCWHGICADGLKTDKIKFGSSDWIKYKNPYCYEGNCPDTFIYELRNDNAVIYVQSNININQEVDSPYSYESIIVNLLESFKFEQLNF
ncbi:MAG: hypothetical protein V4668_04030 [Patescibacteria group bacterium]